MTTWSTTDIPDMTGRSAIVTGRQQRHRPRRRPGARRRRRARRPRRPRHGEGPGRRGRRCPAQTEVRRLDLASLASVREFAAGWEGDLDLLINNAGVMRPPLSAHRGRLRAAARHQPPRPLRPDQPAARRHHRARRDRLLDGPPHGRDRLRRPQLGAPALQALARLRAVQARQPAVHGRAPAPAHRRRLQRAGDRRTPGLRRDQPAVQQRPPRARHRLGRREPPARPGRGRRRAADALRGDRATSRATATPARAASRSSAARRSSSDAATLPRTPASRAASGTCRRS